MATPIIMPRQGQSVESCILTAWNVKPGDTVSAGQIVASIETDKATFDVESPSDGTILALFFEEGDDVPVLTHIAAIGEPGEDFDSLRPEDAAPSSAANADSSPEDVGTAPQPVAAPEAAPADATSPASPSTGISPRARGTAHKTGVDVATLAGTGPGGRIIERDVMAAAANAPRLTPAARDAVAAGHGLPPARGTGLAGQVRLADLASGQQIAARPVRDDRVIPVKGVRKIVAERMRQSLETTAQLTLHARFNATVLQSLRARAKEHGETFGLPRLTINDLISFALVRMLEQNPALNAHFLGDRIVEYGAVNLGVAVDTPRGLMVPVVRNANQLSIAALSAEIRQLADDAQKGSINPDLLTGGTFTITTLGALGIEFFTPVLNAPEVAILGVGGISVQPVRDAQGHVTFADTIGLSLTVDHQAVDGAPGARFLKDLCHALENIDLLWAIP